MGKGRKKEEEGEEEDEGKKRSKISAEISEHKKRCFV